jgi:hypothetical protein
VKPTVFVVVCICRQPSKQRVPREIETGDCFGFLRCQMRKTRIPKKRSGEIELRLLILELWPER